MAVANSLMSLDDIFTKKLFRIPDYQRGYAWEREQLEDFWDDLERLEEGKSHYTGLLTLKPLTDKEKINRALVSDDMWKLGKGFNFEVCHVVDGQQRLTTAIILINQLVVHFKSKDKGIILGGVDLEDIRKKYIYDTKKDSTKAVSCIFGYEENDPAYDCLRFEIFKCAGKPGFHQKTKTYYTKNLTKAADFFDERIEELFSKAGTEAVENLYEKLVHCLKFNLHEIDNELDEYVSFETMNNRGKKLSNLELLKNRLIYLTTLLNDGYTDDERTGLRNNINDAWKEVYYWLGKNPKHHSDDSDHSDSDKSDNNSLHLSDDDFLRQHRIIYYKKPDKKAGEVMDFFMNQTFSPKKLKKDKSRAKKPGEVDYDDIKNYVTSLHDFAEFYYYTYYPEDSNLSHEEKRLLDSLTPSSGRLRLGSFRPLVMVILYRDDIDVADRKNFFKALERLIFIHSLQKSTRSDFGSFSYFYAKKLRLKEIDLNEITSVLESYEDADKDKSVKEFIDKLTDSFDKEKGGYYEFKEFLRHVLYEYECVLAAKNKINKISDVKELFTSDWGDNISVEHIFPQKSTEYWNNVFNVDAKEKYALQGALGNLLLLSRKINSSVQNYDFDTKKNRYKNSSHSAIEVAENEQWTAAEILERSKKLVDFMDERWSLNLSDDQKKSLIHLDFVK